QCRPAPLLRGERRGAASRVRGEEAQRQPRAHDPRVPGGPWRAARRAAAARVPGCPHRRAAICRSGGSAHALGPPNVTVRADDAAPHANPAELIALLTPTGRDGPVAMRVLAEAGLDAVACPDMAALCNLVGNGDG